MKITLIIQVNLVLGTQVPQTHIVYPGILIMVLQGSCGNLNFGQINIFNIYQYETDILFAYNLLTKEKNKE